MIDAALCDAPPADLVRLELRGRFKDAALTPRQWDVLLFVAEHRHRHGYSPSLQEIADHLGTSKVSVYEHVRTLLRKGVLVRDPVGRARAIRVPTALEAAA